MIEKSRDAILVLHNRVQRQYDSIMATIVHEFRCDQVNCRKRFDVITEVQTGPGTAAPVRCPHCGVTQKEHAPGKIVNVHAIAVEPAR